MTYLMVWLVIALFVVTMYGIVASVLAIRWNQERHEQYVCSAYWWNRWRKAARFNQYEVEAGEDGVG